MRMKSVSALILWIGTLGYAALLIGVRGPAAARPSEEPVAAPQRIVRKVAPPRHERNSARPQQIYFATAR